MLITDKSHSSFTQGICILIEHGLLDKAIEFPGLEL